MSFPATPILDSGNRGNESPLSNGGMWGPAAYWSDNMLILEGQQFRMAAGDPTGYAGAEYTAAATAGAVKWFVDVPSPSLAHDSSDYFEITLRDTASVDPASPAGYGIGFAANPSVPTELTLSIGRYDAGVFTTLVNSGLKLDAGDAIGVIYDPVSDTLKGYRRSSGAWTLVMQATDATYSGPWIPQWGIVGENIRLDNVGGGAA